ncbi:MAG TPA: hypothetical protein VIO60_03010 [Rectinemataceae bacterium]
MRFNDVLIAFHNQPCFDYSSVALLFPQGDASLRTSLHRFKKSGKLLELRRGLYAFPEPWRKVTLHAPLVANELYKPSYISERWALSWYGIIPEKVELITSLTTRPTRSFENGFGRFIYRTIKPFVFNGWLTEIVAGAAIRIATREKALADFLYLEAGEWTESRMESMRFDPEGIDASALDLHLRATGEQRLVRASEAWKRYASAESAGSISI